MNIEYSMCQVTNLLASQVTQGKQSRESGGLEYSPSYVLDAVLLSDRVKTLDELKDVAHECLSFFLTPVWFD